MIWRWNTCLWSRDYLETTTTAKNFHAAFGRRQGGYYQHFHSINQAFFGPQRITTLAQRPIWGSWASGFLTSSVKRGKRTGKCGPDAQKQLACKPAELYVKSCSYPGQGCRPGVASQEIEGSKKETRALYEAAFQDRVADDHQGDRQGLSKIFPAHRRLRPGGHGSPHPDERRARSGFR